MTKARRDLALATLEAEECGQWPARLLLAAGEAQCTLEQADEARETFGRAVFAARCGSPEMLSAYYGLLAALDDNPVLQTLQLSTCLDALETFPFDTQLLVVLGNYVLARGNCELAIRSFDAAVRFGQITPEVWHLTEVREIAQVCLSVALRAAGRGDEACRTLEAALAEQPDSRRMPAALADLYRMQGKLAEAEAIAGRVSPVPGKPALRTTSLDDGRQLRVDPASQAVPAPLGLAPGRSQHDHTVP